MNGDGVWPHCSYSAPMYLHSWNTCVVDGHNIPELCQELSQAQHVKEKPTAIIARTFKGKGLKGVGASSWKLGQCLFLRDGDLGYLKWPKCLLVLEGPAESPSIFQLEARRRQMYGFCGSLRTELGEMLA